MSASFDDDARPAANRRALASHVCPECAGTEIHRSRPLPWRWRIASVFLVGRRLYRCADCRARFWDRPT